MFYIFGQLSASSNSGEIAYFVRRRHLTRYKKNNLLNTEEVVYEVRTLEFKEKVSCRACERGDALGEAVITRLSNVIDLVAAEARYHEECQLHFFLKSSS